MGRIKNNYINEVNWQDQKRNHHAIKRLNIILSSICLIREFYSVWIMLSFCLLGGFYMNGLLSDSIINQFDYGVIKKNIIDFISAINLLSFKLKNIERPKITPSYEIKYNCFVPTTSSKIENFVIKKIFLEEEIKEIISKYTMAVNSLNDMERKVFIKTYIYEQKDDVMCYEVGVNATKLLQVKKSASIKFSTILDLENLLNNWVYRELIKKLVGGDLCVKNKKYHNKIFLLKLVDKI